MHRPPSRYSRTCSHAVLAAYLLLVGSVAPAAAQQPSPDAMTGLSFVVQAGAGALLTLVIGGGLILVVPEYTERTTDRILEEPIETFLYGFALSIAGFVLVVLLAITIVGIVLVIPIAIAGMILGELGYLAAGRSVADGWGPALVVAVIVAAFIGGVPILGGLVGLVLSSMGIGAWFLDYRDDDPKGGSRPSDIDPATGGTAGATRGRADVTEEWQSSRSGRDASGTGGTGSGAKPGDHDDDEWTAGFDDEGARD